MNCFDCEDFLESANSYTEGHLPECGHEDAPQISGIIDFNTTPDWCPLSNHISFDDFVNRFTKRLAIVFQIPRHMLNIKKKID